MLKKTFFIFISVFLLANINIQTELQPEDKVKLYESLINNVNIVYFQFNDYLPNSKPPADSITINGKRLEQFTSNINDLVFYSGFTNSLKSFTKTNLDSEFMSDQLIAKLSHIPVHQKGYERFLKEYDIRVINSGLRYINPNLIRWVIKNLYISPDTDLFGFKAQEIYNKAFKIFFRRYVESYLYLNKSNSLVISAKKAYLKNTFEELQGTSKINNFDLLIKTYGKKLKINYVDSEDAIAIGFWIRRNIDQTDKALWSGLTKIMKNYDNNWFSNG